VTEHLSERLSTTCPLVEEGTWPPAQLNTDYDARATVGETFADEMRAYREGSDRQREQWLRHENVVYDASSGQTLDIYGPASSDALRPVFLFIHGGYWRALSKADSAAMAGLFAGNGFATAVVDYTLAPEAPLQEIVRQVRSAARFLWEEGARFGLDRSAIHIGGSSAGAHLAATVLADGWRHEQGLPDHLVRSAVLLSGLYELAPLASAFPQEWLSLSKDDVAALSPIRHVPESGCPVLVAYADSEPAGFKRQSRAFHEAWVARGHASRIIEVEGRNHFNLLMDLGADGSVVAREALAIVLADRSRLRTVLNDGRSCSPHQSMRCETFLTTI
jgi:arylformamidase